MRLTASDDGDETESIQRELAMHAYREGFELERLFIERLRTDGESAFFTLVEAVKNAEVKHVIVPSLWHFARLPGLSGIAIHEADAADPSGRHPGSPRAD
ncbi:hypothetical protein [Streptomyces sp. NBC_00878]|uniref:hypothetical protein n=1 Tax=Streptomyces sp. NBC_00878 TaxID=2975854 RepID=UPI002253FC17|nr:hypothetical protein [Streptomyces sp. NBC_00878]MCX4904403.1 hypothetical protein [Streptomyces sp. NBC_00878]